MGNYKVTIAIDSLDPNPEVIYFDDFYEAEEFVYETVELRVAWRVEHSQGVVSEEERQSWEEEEMQLVRLQDIKFDEFIDSIS